MSLILDALRKSEIARRRAEAPDLFASIPQQHAAQQQHRQWPYWLIAILGLLSLFSTAWLLTRRHAAPIETSADASASRSTEAQDNDIQARHRSTEITAASQPASDTIATSNIDAVAVAQNTNTQRNPPTDTQIGAPPSARPALRSTSTQAPRDTSSRMPSDSDADIAVAQNLPDPPAQSDVLPAVKTVTTSGLPLSSVPLSSVPSSSVPLSSVPSLRTLPSASTSNARSQILRVGDLDPGTRKQLPPLKLSMHLWNETASQRLVILDGQRLREGDLIGDAVVEQIARDGVILSWRGSRLKIDVR